MGYLAGASAIAFALVCAFAGWERHEAAHWHDAYISQTAQYEAAQAAAQADAKKDHDAAEAKYKQLAEDAHNEYQASLDTANAAADRYIASWRVRGDSKGTAGTTAAGTQGATPEGSDRPGGASVMVAVEPDDIKICTRNTERLIAVHGWATELDK